MTQVTIRHRLVTWFEEFEDKFAPGGVNRREHISHMGEEVDIPNDEIERIKSVNSEWDPPFYSDEDADLIREGTYKGRDAATVFRMRSGQKPQSRIEPADGEGINVSSLDADELADYIKENDLTVPQVVALVPEDADLETLEKFYDAENIASDNSPRKGVTEYLETRMAALPQ